MLTPFAPQRIDLFLAPLISDEMSPEVFDLSEEGMQELHRRALEMRTPLAGLLSVLYREMIKEIEFASPRFESGAVPLTGDDAYLLQGVVRLQ